MHYNLFKNERLQTAKSKIQTVKTHSFKIVKKKIILDVLNKND